MSTPRVLQGWTYPDDQAMPREHHSDVVASVLGSLVGMFAVLSTIGLAALGFAGGTVPVLGWALPGGVLPGLAWLAFLGSAGVVVLWVVPMLAAMAVYALLARVVAPVTMRRVRPASRRPGRVMAAKHAA